jgi:hypothetical protein
MEYFRINFDVNFIYICYNFGQLNISEMSKKSPSEQRKTIDDEWIRVTFRKETSHGLLLLFKASAKFREHNRNAISKIKLRGDSMLNETSKIGFN